MEFGINKSLMKCVRKSGWSVEELSHIMRFSESLVYRYLSGEEPVDVGTKYLFAEVLNMPIEEIFPGFTEDEDG